MCSHTASLSLNWKCGLYVLIQWIRNWLYGYIQNCGQRVDVQLETSDVLPASMLGLVLFNVLMTLVMD